MDFVLAKSFNDIYTAFYRKSYLYVKSYVQEEMVAEDIVSDSLIKLWEQLRQKPIDPVAPYLFSMLKNRALDYLKHQNIKHDVHGLMTEGLERELQIRISSLESSDPKEVFSSEIQQIVEKTLNSLPERTREIFVLSRFGNKSHKEIAELYNISVKGVEYHIGQSVSTLRVTLKDYLPLIGILSFLKL